MVFYDVGAVVHFLRKVPRTVPGFTVDGYADQLARMHRRIRSRGPFVSHAQLPDRGAQAGLTRPPMAGEDSAAAWAAGCRADSCRGRPDGRLRTA
jgi:hypothetical protein